jgi:hypothetical protein
MAPGNFIKWFPSVLSGPVVSQFGAGFSKLIIGLNIFPIHLDGKERIRADKSGKKLC